MVTLPLYPASNNLEIMLSTSNVLLGNAELGPGEVPSANGLGEDDKPDEPGPAERFAWGEEENADGGGGEDERKGLPVLPDPEAMMVCVVGMFGFGVTDVIDDLDPWLVGMLTDTSPLGSSRALVGGGGDLLLP